MLGLFPKHAGILRCDCCFLFCFFESSDLKCYPCVPCLVELAWKFDPCFCWRFELRGILGLVFYCNLSYLKAIPNFVVCWRWLEISSFSFRGDFDLFVLVLAVFSR